MSVNRAIVEGLYSGDPSSIKRIFEFYYIPLCHYAKRYVGDAVVAEEVVSDVIYKVWQNRKTVYHAGTFREYLFMATRNTALNYLKQQQNIRKLSDHWADHLRDELIGETPLDMLITTELQSRLDELVGSLPEQCRKVFWLSRIDNFTYEEIAIQMNISVNTVKHHMKTALQKLRAGLKDFMACFFI